MDPGVSQYIPGPLHVFEHPETLRYYLICSMTPQTLLPLAPPPLPTPMPSHCASGACGRPPLMSRCGAWAAGSGCCAAAWSIFPPATGVTLQAGQQGV